MINHWEGGLICDVITQVHTKVCSADIHIVENHNNKLYRFMVPMTPFLWSWLMDYFPYVELQNLIKNLIMHAENRSYFFIF